MPSEKLFGPQELWPTELWLAVVWLGLSIVMRLAAVNLGSAEAIRAQAARAARVGPVKKVVGVTLALVLGAGIAVLVAGAGRLLFPGKSSATNRNPDQLAQTAWRLWQAQKWDEAARKFNQALKFAPQDANTWNGLGWARFDSGKIQAAEIAFQKAVSLDPHQPGALNGLGQIRLQQRRYAEAEKYLLRAAPQAPAAWYGLARLYLLEGKFDQAAKWAQDLIDAGQTDALVRQMLKAAKAKHVSEGLRFRIEPHPPTQEKSGAPANPSAAGATNQEAASRVRGKVRATQP